MSMPSNESIKIKLVIFDVNQTMFSLNEIEKRFDENNLNTQLVESWFNAVLKEGFSYSLSGRFIDFITVGRNELRKIFLKNTLSVNEENITYILNGFKELKVHRDILNSLKILNDNKINVVTLTNGSILNTKLLLQNNKIENYINECFSIDQFNIWKPHKDVYLKTCNIMKTNPKNSLMIAAHGWDINGANLAGLKTAFIDRYEKSLSDFYSTPNFYGEDSYDIISNIKF